MELSMLEGETVFVLSGINEETHPCHLAQVWCGEILPYLIQGASSRQPQRGLSDAG